MTARKVEDSATAELIVHSPQLIGNCLNGVDVGMLDTAAAHGITAPARLREEPLKRWPG